MIKNLTPLLMLSCSKLSSPTRLLVLLPHILASLLKKNVQIRSPLAPMGSSNCVYTSWQGVLIPVPRFHCLITMKLQSQCSFISPLNHSLTRLHLTLLRKPHYVSLNFFRTLCVCGPSWILNIQSKFWGGGSSHLWEVTADGYSVFYFTDEENEAQKD